MKSGNLKDFFRQSTLKTSTTNGQVVDSKIKGGSPAQTKTEKSPMKSLSEIKAKASSKP